MKEVFGLSPLFGINLAADLNAENNMICVNDSVFAIN